MTEEDACSVAPSGALACPGSRGGRRYARQRPRLEKTLARRGGRESGTTRGGPPKGRACGGENDVCRRGEHRRAKAMEYSVADRLAKSSKDRDGLGPTAIRR